MRSLASNLPLGATLALSMFIVSCSDGNNAQPAPAPPPVQTPSPSPTPTPTPTPTPSPTGGSINVEPCLTQTVVPGRTVADLVVPDVINIDLSRPSGFPNGRRLQDPTPDVTLAALFLDLRVHSPLTFANVPLNPATNDRPFTNTFPFMAPPQGNPPIAPSTGSNFNFRTDPASAFVRVDREGMPAVATALVVGNADKDAFNDDDPEDDARGVWVPEFVSTLTALHQALADDIRALGLTVCSTGG